MFEAMLVARGIRFVLVSGVAAAVHGSARFTNDLDLCYDAAPDNVERLVTLLSEWMAYLRGVEPGIPFILDARTFRTTPLLTLTSSMGTIDLLIRCQGSATIVQRMHSPNACRSAASNSAHCHSKR